MTVCLPAASKTGYDFTGWSGTDINNYTQTITITQGSTGNRSYTANFSIATYTISYIMNNAEQPAYTSFTIETPTFTIPAASKTGYIFTGWSGSNLSGNPTTITITQGSTGNRSYTANFSPISYTISYTMNDAVQPSYETFTIETPTFTIPAASKTGYTFTGWSGTNIDNYTQTITISQGSTGDRSYVANFTPTSYTITYNLNDGTNNANNRATYTIEDTPFTIEEATKQGYTFNGWTGDGYSTPTTPITIAAGSTGNKTFTASWTVISYNVTFDATDYTIENYGSSTINGGSTSYAVKIKILRNSSYVTSGIRAYVKGTALYYSSGYWQGTATLIKVSDDITLHQYQQRRQLDRRNM